jgi:hypothetical protein
MQQFARKWGPIKRKRKRKRERGEKGTSDKNEGREQRRGMITLN